MNNNNNDTTGTDHPYTTEPPPNTPNPYHHADQCCDFFNRVFSILIGCVFLLLITGTVLFFIWFIHQPRIPEFRVDSVTVSNLNLSSTLISGNWDVQFSVRNPNKKITVLYDHIDASVLYKSDSLSSTTMTPFSQGTKNQTTVRATFTAVSSYVDSSVVSEINGDRSRESVKFSVRLLARARFKGGAWGFKPYVTVLCRDLPVGIPLLTGRGSLIGGSRECKVVFGRYNRF